MHAACAKDLEGSLPCHLEAARRFSSTLARACQAVCCRLRALVDACGRDLDAELQEASKDRNSDLSSRIFRTRCQLTASNAPLGLGGIRQEITGSEQLTAVDGYGRCSRRPYQQSERSHPLEFLC